MSSIRCVSRRENFVVQGIKSPGQELRALLWTLILAILALCCPLLVSKGCGENGITMQLHIFFLNQYLL